MQKMTQPRIGFDEVPAALGGLQRGTGRWDGKPARPPKKGEFYLSGAVPMAHQAPNDLSTPYFIAIVTTSDGKHLGGPISATPLSTLADQMDALADSMKQSARELRQLGVA